MKALWAFFGRIFRKMKKSAEAIVAAVVCFSSWVLGLVRRAWHWIRYQVASGNAKEMVRLIGLRLVVFWRNFVEWLKVVVRYYGRWEFVKADSLLLLSYLFQNPFRVSKRFLLAKGAQDVHVYGETPLTTMEKIARQSGLTAQDTVFELGCGRGRVCFWLHAFVGCQVVGIEWVPDFVAKAIQVQQRAHLSGLSFRMDDMVDADLTGATAIYLYGTCLDRTSILKLVDKFDKLPSGTKIITVSFSLADYSDGSAFEVMRVFPARFTWGEADVYLQCRR